MWRTGKNYSKALFLITAILSFLTLPATFIWLEIGPEGKAWYGNDVPDVFIRGAIITGKDLSFWGISFAFKFQFLVILYYSVSNFLCAFSSGLIPYRKIIAIVNFILLLPFPYWLYCYVGGVICNSDGAANDLTIHYGNGLILFVIILILHGWLLKSVLAERSKPA